MVEYFLGTIKSRVEEGDIKKEDYIITADIPGIMTDVRAFPNKDSLDEPKVGDQVILISYDSFYHSYFTYTKLKENDVIGFRASGKMIDITPEKITIGVFDESKEYKDSERPECDLSYVIMDNSGNIEIHTTGNTKVKIDGECNVEVSGNCNIKSSGTVNIDGGPMINLNGDSLGGIVKKKYLDELIAGLITDIPLRSPVNTTNNLAKFTSGLAYNKTIKHGGDNL